MPENFEKQILTKEKTNKIIETSDKNLEKKKEEERQNILDNTKKDLEFRKKWDEIKKELDKNINKLNIFWSNKKILEKAISFLPEEKQIEAKNFKNFDDFLVFYAKETWIIFLIDEKENIYKCFNIYDNEREISELDIKNYLPKDNFYINEFKNFSKNKTKVIPTIDSWAFVNYTWNIIYLWKESWNFNEKDILANESLHILFNEIWYYNLDYSKKILWKKYNKYEIEEFLSEFSSLKNSKEHTKIRFLEILFSKYNNKINENYSLIWDFYEKLFKEILDEKSIEKFQKIEFIEILELFSEDFKKEIESKTITYNWQTFSWFDYIFYRIEEQSNIFLKDIYELKMKEKVK